MRSPLRAIIWFFFVFTGALFAFQVSVASSAHSHLHLASQGPLSDDDGPVCDLCLHLSPSRAPVLASPVNPSLAPVSFSFLSRYRLLSSAFCPAAYRARAPPRALS